MSLSSDFRIVFDGINDEITALTEAVENKADNPAGGTAGQVLTKTENGEEWADAKNPTFIGLENKTLSEGTSYIVDFNGKPIQKYDGASKAAGEIEISYANLDLVPDGCAPTVELQLAVFSSVSSVVLPSSTIVLDMPETLSGAGVETSAVLSYTTHDIVFRSQKDGHGQWKTYVNYAYNFEDEENNLDYFWIMPLEDGATISPVNFNTKYNLSASIGNKDEWFTLSSTSIATNVKANTKVYVRGNTLSLGASNYYAGFHFSVNKPYAVGGNLFSLYSYDLADKELNNINDVKQFFKNNVPTEVSLNLGKVTNASDLFMNGDLRTIKKLDGCENLITCGSMFRVNYNLSSLPPDLSFPNAESVDGMFYDCRALSSLPENFSAPNATNANAMFFVCLSLQSLPDGFSLPNVTSVVQMFYDCRALTTIGNNVKIANGPSATSTDDTYMNKSKITTIGDGFEWFTNATFSGTWDPALGIKNVFPNATALGSWKVYNHSSDE